MSAVYQSISITIDGQAYEVTPTFQLINRIETPKTAGGLGIKIGALAVESVSPHVPPITEYVRIITMMLIEKGVAVDCDDVYQALMGSDENDVIEVCNAVLGAILPKPKGSVKQSVDDGSKKKQTTISSGKSSTK
jgi:hypothetical protein